MKKVVTHQQIFRTGPWGSTLNTTLCGRMSEAGEDMNVGDAFERPVTCKLCLKRLAKRKDTLPDAGKA